MEIFKNKNVSKLIAVGMLVLIFILAIFSMPQNAAQVNRCKISVVDDGSSQKKENAEVGVKQQIISSTDKEVTFQVDFENYQYKATEIALVLDNSYSMWSQDKLLNSKSSIVSMVETIFNDIENVQMSLSTYDGTKIAMGKDKDSIISQINNINTYEGITTKTGLTYGKSTFTDKDTDKYIIIYTDGEENISDVISEIKNNNIKLITAFYGNDRLISRQYALAGTVYEIANITQENINNANVQIKNNIKQSMTKQVNNVRIENIFSDEIQNNFTFELAENASDGTITPINNGQGYEWNISKLTKDKATFKYKLKLNNNLDRSIMYTDIATNKQMKVNYTSSTSLKNIILLNENTPVINIAEAYTLKIKAINKRYTGINAKNIEFKIEQIDTNGNVVKTITDESGNNFKTNNDGEIILDDITDIGTYTYRITQIGTPAEYELSDESKRVQTLTVTKNFESNTLTATKNGTDDIFEVETNDYEQIVTATIKMDPREFSIKMYKIDEEYKTGINGVKINMLEPKSDSIPEGISVKGPTSGTQTMLGKDGYIQLTGQVAGQGTWTYKLEEENTPTGYYENKEKMSISITFNEEGKPTNVTSNSKSVIINEDEPIEGDTINLNVTNKMLDYTLRIQAFNQKYKNIKIDNVKVSITGKDESGKTVYSKEEITKNGKIELPINKFGKITYTIKQISAPAEYSLTADTTYTITRDFDTNNLVLNSPTGNEDITLDNENKLLNVNIYLNQKTFNFKLNKIDKDDNTIKLDGAKIKLVQPSQRDSIEKTTQNGELNYEADVVCQTENPDRTYKTLYYLQELEKPTGYQKINGNSAVEITFNSNGEVINAVSKSTENLDVVKNNSEVEVNLKNEKQSYEVKIVTKNKNYKDIIIPNIGLNITGSKDNNTFLPQKQLTTDQNGEATLQNLRQDGILKFDIEETSVPVRIFIKQRNSIF